MSSSIKSWEELSELEQLACEYSDYHKEAYGYRPRNDVSGWTVADYKDEFNILSRVCTENRKLQEAAEREAIDAFESLVKKLVTVNGVPDRDAAVRHLVEAEGVDGDMEYFCFRVGLPYGYLKAA